MIEISYGNIYFRKTLLLQEREMLKSVLLFLVAPSYERSDLSSDHSVHRFGWLVGCMFGCLLTFSQTPLPPPTPPPHKIIGSQQFQNQNVFHVILSNFLGGDPLPPTRPPNFPPLPPENFLTPHLA